jgi:hypothetical protein
MVLTIATDTRDLYELARAADPNVGGAAVVDAARPEWFTVARADGLVVRLDTATGGAPTQAARDAVLSADLSAGAVAARVKARLRPVADAAFAAADDSAARDRAIVLVAIDEINLLRQWITSFKAAVALAASLADLKTRVAALDNLPDRTAAQAKNAVVAKIDAGAAD